MSKERFEQILKAQKESGLTIREYCEKIGVTTKSFYNWRLRFIGKRQAEVSSTQPHDPDLVPINIAPAKSPQGSERQSTAVADSHIMMELPGGTKVSFYGNSQAGALNIIAKLMNV